VPHALALSFEGPVFGARVLTFAFPCTVIPTGVATFAPRERSRAAEGSWLDPNRTAIEVRPNLSVHSALFLCDLCVNPSLLRNQQL